MNVITIGKGNDHMIYVICLITSLFFCLSDACEKEGTSSSSPQLGTKIAQVIPETNHHAKKRKAIATALVRHLDRRLTAPVTNRIVAALGSGKIFINIKALWDRYLEQENVHLPLPIVQFGATDIQALEQPKDYISIVAQLRDKHKIQRKAFACDVMGDNGCVLFSLPGQVDIPAHYTVTDRRALFNLNGVMDNLISPKMFEVSGQRMIVASLDHIEGKGARQFVVTKPDAIEQHMVDSDQQRFADHDKPCTLYKFSHCVDQTTNQ